MFVSLEKSNSILNKFAWNISPITSNMKWVFPSISVEKKAKYKVP